MHDPELNLARAADVLFNAFRNYRGQANWGDALDNMSPEDDLAPVRHRVRELPAHLFYYYGFHAVSLGQADTSALKYFFPRVLYEAAFPPDWESHRNAIHGPICVEMYISYMLKLNWRRWPDAEREAIEGFFHAWLLTAIATPDRSFEQDCGRRDHRYAETVLRIASFLDIDTSEMLAAWHHEQSEAATMQVADMIRMHGHFIAATATLERWDRIWGTEGASPDAIERVVKFLTHPRNYSRLERAFFDAKDPNIQKELSEAVFLLTTTYNVWHQAVGPGGKIPGWAVQRAAEMCTLK